VHLWQSGVCFSGLTLLVGRLACGGGGGRSGGESG